MTAQNTKPTVEQQLREQLNAARDEVADLRERLNEQTAEQVEHDAVRGAIASLHEQAHGNHSIRLCQVEPCRTLGVDYSGPAPAALIP